jgi:hypothetical protein
MAGLAEDARERAVMGPSTSLMLRLSSRDARDKRGHEDSKVLRIGKGRMRKQDLNERVQWTSRRSGKMLRVICLFLMVISPAANAGQFYSYRQWVALDEALRSVYMAGVFDGLLGIVKDRNDIPVTKHYDACITRANMSDRQLADSVIAFVKTRPELQERSVSGALMNYLIAFCGAPPTH